MDEETEIVFNVDEQYENEKGVFRVVSIHRDEMIIRWENGEEIKTDIKLQRRIAERRRWEESQRASKAAAASNSSGKSAATAVKPEFPGFTPTDFKNSASGTTWRSRYQLGAMVTKKINAPPFVFSSWAFQNKPEMHVQDIKHHRLSTPDYLAKYFVRVDQDSLHYGFRVARPEHNDDSTDWDAFRRWLALPENEQLVHSIATRDDLTVSDRAHPRSGVLRASDDGWYTDVGGQEQDRETLAACIDDFSDAEPFELEIAATMAKNDAMACGRDIATNIAALFTRLAPLYKAATTH